MSAPLQGNRPTLKLPGEEFSLVIGREDDTADVVIDNPHVSAVHAKLECDEFNCTLIDMGSTNGE